jgi:hypothetical protein
MTQKSDLSAIERWRASRTRTTMKCPAGRRSAAEIRLVSIGIALALCACSKVNVTPLGATRDGRRQYEITCNAVATDNGSCHERAVALCGGSYETLSLGSVGPELGAYNGQTFTPAAERVLLVACNRRTKLAKCTRLASRLVEQ